MSERITIGLPGSERRSDAQAGQPRRLGIPSYLQLIQPPNLVITLADVLAGFAVTGLMNVFFLPALAVAAIALYAGGRILNDSFTRPDIPHQQEETSGSDNRPLRTPLFTATAFFITGIGFAFISGVASGCIAVMIAGLLMFYNTRTKQHRLFGPIMMGLYRGLNLLLGVSAVSELVLPHSYLVLIPASYVGAMAALNRGKEHEGEKRALAMLLMVSVFLAIILLGLSREFAAMAALPFLAFLGWRLFPSFWRAFRTPTSEMVEGAVKIGAISVILLDASLAAGFGGILYGGAVLMLFFIAKVIGRLFAGT